VRVIAYQAVLALAVAAGASGCGQEISPSDSGAGVAEPSPPPAAVPARPVPSYSMPTREGRVVAHARIADPAALLAKLEPLLPAGFADQLAPETVRTRLAKGASPVAAGMIAHVDLERAAGCVLLGPSADQASLACVFGYAGGLEQLRSDLGSSGVRDEGQAALHLERDGQAWYFDAFADATPGASPADRDVIVFATQPDAYEASRGYLDQLRRPGGEHDVEVLLHTAYAMATHREAITSVFVRAAVAAHSAYPSTGIEAELADLALNLFDELVGWVAEADRVLLHASVADEGLVLGAQLSPTVGSAMARAAARAPAVDPNVWEWLPNGTWLTWASQRAGPPRAARWTVIVSNLLTRYIAKFVERSPEDVVKAADELAESQALSYGDWSLFAAFNSPATRGGALLVRPKKPGGDARTAWLALAQAATAEALFGAELGRTVRDTVEWKVVPGARTVEGLTVDEWQLAAAPGLLESLEASLPAGGIGKQVVAALRGRESLLAVQRFEFDGAVVFAFAPGGGEAYVRKIISAKQGSGRLDRAGVDAITARYGKLRTVAAFSGFDLLQAIREALPPSSRAGLPATAGRDLSDGYAAAATASDGSLHYELVVSAFVLEGLRALLRAEQTPPDSN